MLNLQGQILGQQLGFAPVLGFLCKKWEIKWMRKPLKYNSMKVNWSDSRYFSSWYRKVETKLIQSLWHPFNVRIEFPEDVCCKQEKRD